MIKTKVKLLTILSLVGIFLLLGIYAYSILEEINWNEIEAKQIMILFSIVFFEIIISILLYKSSVVSFDEEKQRIKIRKNIFSFKNHDYGLNEIDGFRFLRLKGKVSFKGIEIKTKKGKKFILNELIIKNLKEFENAFLQYLELKSGKVFKDVSQKGENREILENKRFEKHQQDEIRDYMYLVIGISIVFLSILIYFNESMNPEFISVFLIFISIIAISIIKLLKIPNRPR